MTTDPSSDVVDVACRCLHHGATPRNETCGEPTRSSHVRHHPFR